MGLFKFRVYTSELDSNLTESINNPHVWATWWNGQFASTTSDLGVYGTVLQYTALYCTVE